ncbi:RNA-directed DNA polymerase, eukaryota, reverse transcriptase zinc-binding domain protein, partial [Tanacetum coccineum]
LLVSYLGVPLITKQLGVKECKSLIDRVKSKVNNWKNKLLSYAGRLQLVASVLASMQVYWASGNLSKGKAKVAWKLVCRPKKEGGLGIKNLSVWNEVLMAKHLWNIACNKESLWVKWINVVRLKGTSIWEVKANSNTCCGWKHILSLRSKMRPHVKYEIGNGETALLWHDRWWEGGVLNDLFPLDSLSVANTFTKVCEMISNGKWKWPMSWTRHYPQLNSIPVPNLVESGYKVVWENNNGEKVKFSINIMWKDWVQIGVKIAWLSTQDKIIKWYPGKQVSCPLCEECPDSHEHLFFKCPYSMKIWNELKKKINMEEVNNDWENILNRVTDMACKNSIRSVLRRVVLAACVYYIWDERNKRFFDNQKRNHEALMQLIINNIRMKLVSLKVKNSIQVSTVSKDFFCLLEQTVVNKAALRLRIGGYRLRIGGYNLRVKFLQVQEYRAQMMRILTLWDQAVMAMQVLEGIAYRLQHPWVGIVNRSQADINKNTGMIYAGKRSGSILLQELITGVLPYQNQTYMQLAFAVVNKGLPPNEPDVWLHVLSEIMTRSWDMDPNVIPSFS